MAFFRGGKKGGGGVETQDSIIVHYHNFVTRLFTRGVVATEPMPSCRPSATNVIRHKNTDCGDTDPGGKRGGGGFTSTPSIQYSRRSKDEEIRCVLSPVRPVSHSRGGQTSGDSMH